jgi:isopenicillin N synthase-like dioxygenase
MSRNDTQQGLALPIVDLDGLALEGPLNRFVAASLDTAFRSTGFCYVANTGVSNTSIERIFAASKEFHALDRSAKDRIAINAFHRGYMAPKSSLIQTSSVAKVTRPNLSESFMAMHEVAESSPRFGLPLQGPNQWPGDLPELRQSVLAYLDEMTVFARRFTALLAVALGLSAEHFDRHFTHPTIWLRLLHYPPQPVDMPHDQFGSAPHTDYGFLTLLAQDENGGLEVRDRSGQWLPAQPLPGTFIVNVADMLARMTNNRWPSTPHRVRNLTGKDRYSVPFFWDTNMDSQIACLDRFASDAEQAPDPVIFGHYVMERLDRNYAYRKHG